MIQDLSGRKETKFKKMQGMFSKDIEEVKNRDEQYSRRNQLHNNWDRIDKCSGDRMVAITAVKQTMGKKMTRNEDSLKDNIKWTNIHIIRVSEGGKIERTQENI